MRYLPFKFFAPAVVLFTVAACVAALAQTPAITGIGTAPTQEEIRAAAKGTGPAGKDLPSGRGTAKDGAKIFLVKCAMCHGVDGQGVVSPPGSFSELHGPRLVGGKGLPLWGPKGPTPGISKVHYAAFVTTIWNSIAISMPFFKPGSLAPDEVYSLTAFILYKNEMIKEDDIMDRETLPKVQLPQRNNYIPVKVEDIPDIQKRGCFKTYGVCP